MFSNLKRKLFAIFLTYSLLAVLVFALSDYYTNEKEKIDLVQQSLTSIYMNTLKDFEVIDDYFSVDTKNDHYFITGFSKNIELHIKNVEEIESELNRLNKNKTSEKIHIRKFISNIEKQFIQYSKNVNEIEKLINRRGYKDYGYEGEMRDYIHSIENFDNIDQVSLLLIRRHEKDYIIRNEQKYIKALKSEVNIFRNKIIQNQSLSLSRKDLCLVYLQSYETLFDSIVVLDKKIGIKTNSGLKLELRQIQKEIETEFNNANALSAKTKADLYKRIQIDFIFYTVLLVIFSLIFSYYLSKIITRPISALAKNVHDYVNSGFEDSKELTVKTSNYEIKNLIINFSSLKKELSELINNFKTKVKERTLEVEGKNNKLELQKEEIESQNEHLQSQNIVIEIQKKNLEEKNFNLLSSIRYAKQLQDALTPDINDLKGMFKDSFVLNMPKDIVSGDFFWFKNIKNENYNVSLFAVADCTGHGVPGAMMSMLAIALLNEIVYRKSVKSSNQVLDELRAQIKKSLRQTGQKPERQDGLDIAFCVIDNDTKELSFSGAYNPLWIFRENNNSKFQNNEDLFEFIEFKGNKQPVGVYPNETPFVEHKILLKHNDVIYMFSDGFHSQISSKTNRKLNKNDMKYFIYRSINKSIKEQCKYLEKEFTNWKGNFEQVDDVLVLGIKI